MKKIEKNKVGRPKLADSKMKKESILLCLFVLVTLFIFAYLGFRIINISIKPNELVGTVYNDHINSCKTYSNKIDCGPNVSYVKYKINDEDYKEIYKEDKSIEVKINSSDKVKLCYKTNSKDKETCIN